MLHRLLIWFTILFFLSGCTARRTPAGATPLPAGSSEIQPAANPSALPPKATLIPTETAAAPKPTLPAPETLAPTPAATLPDPPTATSSPTATIAHQDWRLMPVIPAISDKVTQIYQRGQELGNNPLAFSKIGDCGSTPAWFLGDFDRGPAFYRLGDYQDLDSVIQAYQGSYGRTSLAARSGFNASSVFTSLWSDRKQCDANETPLACEYRNHRPSVAFIMLGTNDVWHPDEFEPQMRKIIEFSIEQGIVPVLSTKADNAEGDESINATIARLALEYDIPLWNYWAAVQGLPDKGLQEDLAHLTWARNFFDDPEAMEKAWPVRNLTALQILQAIWLKVGEPAS